MPFTKESYFKEFYNELYYFTLDVACAALFSVCSNTVLMPALTKCNVTS